MLVIFTWHLKCNRIGCYMHKLSIFSAIAPEKERNGEKERHIYPNKVFAHVTFRERRAIAVAVEVVGIEHRRQTDDNKEWWASDNPQIQRKSERENEIQKTRIKLKLNWQVGVCQHVACGSVFEMRICASFGRWGQYRVMHFHFHRNRMKSHRACARHLCVVCASVSVHATERMNEWASKCIYGQCRSSYVYYDFNWSTFDGHTTFYCTQFCIRLESQIYGCLIVYGYISISIRNESIPFVEFILKFYILNAMFSLRVCVISIKIV